MQTVDITVKGGHAPNLIGSSPGHRGGCGSATRASSDCTSKAVFPDRQVSEPLAVFATTTADAPPGERDEYGFACGMNMVHGTLLVESDGTSSRTKSVEDAQGVDAAPIGLRPENLDPQRVRNAVHQATGPPSCTGR